MMEKSTQADKLACEVLNLVSTVMTEKQLDDEQLKGLLEQTARARLVNYPVALSGFLLHLELGGIPPRLAPPRAVRPAQRHDRIARTRSPRPYRRMT